MSNEDKKIIEDYRKRIYKYNRLCKPLYEVPVAFEDDIADYIQETISKVRTQERERIYDWLAYQRDTDINGNWLVSEEDFKKFINSSIKEE